MNHFFDKIYCLNQESRPDRWEQAEDEFLRVGIEVERFLSIPADQPNQSFCLSQYAMLKKFLDTDGKTLLTLEDDVLFKNLDHLGDAMKDLPEDWDILYLGTNITETVFGIREFPPVRYSKHLFRLSRAWTTHALAYSRKAVEDIIARYPVHSFEMYDNWLSEHYLADHNSFLVNPMVAWQRPVFSDLWGSPTNYTGAFEWGDKYMSI